MKLDKNGVLSGIPYLGMAICNQTQGFLSDRLRTKYKMKTTHVRQFTTSAIPIYTNHVLIISCQGSEDIHQWKFGFASRIPRIDSFFGLVHSFCSVHFPHCGGSRSLGYQVNMANPNQNCRLTKRTISKLLI